MVFGVEMNDGLEKTSSSLAIVEKKPQRPGGCVGIFFQLFDWNCRFAKKKLFSKKLLPPVRLKSASKKFGGDDKQPKHRLIADENSGGFPNPKKSSVDSEVKHEMRTPSLVARLMGLESMPALQRDKSKKVQSSGFKTEKYTDGVREYEKEDVEKGAKLDSRPQKLQKTSFSERRTMTRFGADALPFKNVLSKSRKHHQKLPSPVKSPRNLSRRTTSKLMGAATKILEPGLQRNQSNCALTYPNNLPHLPQGNGDFDETMDLEPSEVNNPDCLMNVSPERGVSCRNCGHVKDNVEPGSRISEKPLIFASPFSQYGGTDCDRSERCNLGHPVFCKEFEEEMNEDYFPVAAQVHKNIRSSVKPTSDRRVFSGHMRPQKDASSSFCPNQQSQCQNQMLRARHTIPTRTKPNSSCEKVTMGNVVHGGRNPFSPNPSFSGSNRPRMSARIDNGKFEMEKRIAGRQNDCIPGRKRRPVNASRQPETPVFTNSSIKKQTYGYTPLVSAKEFVFGVQSVSQQSYRSGDSQSQQRTVGSHQADNHVTFTSISPVQRKTGTNSVEKRMFQSDSCHGRISQRSSLGENDRRAAPDSPCPISGDALGALLEQKLKELTYQGEECGSSAPRKTTATILQELISALTSDIPLHQNNCMAPSDTKVNINDQSHLLTSKAATSSQANTMSINPPVDQSPDSEHRSPGSVLEAYFSNESCLSSSLDDSFGYKMPLESADCSYNKPHALKHESELLDSATSTTAMKCCKESVDDILDIISETLCCINPVKYGLKGNTLDHVKVVLLNSELVLRGAASTGTFIQQGSSVKHLLLDGPETLAGILSVNFGRSLEVDGSEEENRLERFALDAIIEYLDLRFGRYPEPGEKVSGKLPLCIDGKSLLFEIIEEVPTWGELSRFTVDELVEWEMSHSLREWTQFDTEMYETGMDISSQLCHVLLDEIVEELKK